MADKKLSSRAVQLAAAFALAGLSACGTLLTNVVAMTNGPDKITPTTSVIPVKAEPLPPIPGAEYAARAMRLEHQLDVVVAASHKKGVELDQSHAENARLHKSLSAAQQQLADAQRQIQAAQDQLRQEQQEAAAQLNAQKAADATAAQAAIASAVQKQKEADAKAGAPKQSDNTDRNQSNYLKYIPETELALLFSAFLAAAALAISRLRKKPAPVDKFDADYGAAMAENARRDAANTKTAASPHPAHTTPEMVGSAIKAEHGAYIPSATEQKVIDNLQNYLGKGYRRSFFDRVDDKEYYNIYNPANEHICRVQPGSMQVHKLDKDAVKLAFAMWGGHLSMDPANSEAFKNQFIKIAAELAAKNELKDSKGNVIKIESILINGKPVAADMQATTIVAAPAPAPVKLLAYEPVETLPAAEPANAETETLPLPNNQTANETPAETVRDAIEVEKSASDPEPQPVAETEQAAQIAEVLPAAESVATANTAPVWEPVAHDTAAYAAGLKTAEIVIAKPYAAEATLAQERLIQEQAATLTVQPTTLIEHAPFPTQLSPAARAVRGAQEATIKSRFRSFDAANALDERLGVKIAITPELKTMVLDLIERAELKDQHGALVHASAILVNGEPLFERTPVRKAPGDSVKQQALELA